MKYRGIMSVKMALVDKNIIKMPALEKVGFKPDIKGLGHAYFAAMTKFKSNIFQIDEKTGETETYESFLQRCVRTAIHLKNRGVKENDYLSVCSPNTMSSSVPLIGATFIGANFTYYHPELPVAFGAHILKQTLPKYIFVHPNLIELIEESLSIAKTKTSIVVYGKTDKYESFDEFLKPVAEETSFRPYEVKDITESYFPFFTSGTTGLPKGICLSHYSIMAQSYLYSGMRPKHFDVIMCYSTLFHVSGPVFLSSVIFNGTTTVVQEPFNPNKIWNTLEKLKVNFLFAPTIYATMMYKLGKPKGVDLRYLQEFSIGGSVFTKENIEGIRKMLPNTRLSPCYGQTEAGGVIVSFNYEDPPILELALRKPAASGVPIYGYYYKILDLKTKKPLGPNESGELWVKSKVCMKKYLFEDKSETFDPEGWLCTGDYAHYDNDLCFYITDRLKEVYVVGNFFVAPAIIENKIQEHPSVKLTAVVAVPDEMDVSRSVAVVVLKPDAQKVDPEEIVKFVKESMEERYHLKGGCKIVDSLPMTGIGKVNRALLLKMVINKEI